MVKTNKYILFFLLTAFAMGVLLPVFFGKFIPQVISDTSRYCTSFIATSALHLSHLIRIVPLITVIVMVILAVGTVILLAIQYAQLAKRIASRYALPRRFGRVARALGLEDAVFVLRENIPQAFCAGLQKPAIYVTSALLDMMNERELKTILMHEKNHLIHNDTRLIAVFSVIQALFPFLPFITDVMAQYRIDREIAADADAVSHMNDVKPLLSVFKKLLRYRSEQPTFVFGIGTSDTLEYRVRSLLGRHSHSRTFSIFRVGVTFISLAIMLGTIASPIRAFEIHTDTTDSVVVYLDNTASAAMCANQMRSSAYTQNTVSR